MQELHGIKDILEEAFASKGLTSAKLAATTGIPERFIQGILSGDFRILPAAPYVRGYLKKIAEVLELNNEDLWERYVRENHPHESGGRDELPENRFAIKTINKKMVTLFAIGLLILVYFTLNAKRHFGLPNLSVLYPASSIIIIKEPFVTVRGRIGDTKDLLTVNGVGVFVDEFGEFEKELSLDPGVNNIDIYVKRFLGRGQLESLQVIYEPIMEIKN